MPARGENAGPTAAQVVGEALAHSATTLHGLEAAVRGDVPDSLHQMRVTLRRLRSVLTTFRPLFDEGTADSLRAELRWLGGDLGSARDVEVLHGRLTKRLAEEPSELVRGPVSVRLDGALRSEHVSRQEAAVRVLGSERYAAAAASLHAFLRRPPWSPVARRPAPEVLPRLVIADWERVTRRAAAAAGGPETTHDERLHAVRKAAKRARYATEAALPVLDAEAGRVAHALKEVQAALGAHHDAVVARLRLLAIADDAAAAGEDTFTYGVLLAREESAAVDAEAGFRRAYRKFRQLSRVNHSGVGS